jgi:ribonuclease P protein component
VRGVRLCRTGAARAAARSLPDRTPGFRAVLSARNRMRRSTEFDATVKYGMRTVQPDVIVHVRRGSTREGAKGPRVGLIIAKPVGSAVERHRVARRLRHVARTMLDELDPLDQVVIRALPSSRHVSSVWLEQQLRSGLRRAFELAGPDR